MPLQTQMWVPPNKLSHPFEAVLLLFMAGWVLPKALLLSVLPAGRSCLAAQVLLPSLNSSGSLVLDALLETLRKKIPTAFLKFFNAADY